MGSRTGQLAFDIFDFDGFLGDVMTVNLAYKPFFEVERRKYRFRILNASVSRFFKIALPTRRARSDHPDRQRRQPAAASGTAHRSSTSMGIAERYDIVIDFSQSTASATSLHLVNLRRALGRQAG